MSNSIDEGSINITKKSDEKEKNIIQIIIDTIIVIAKTLSKYSKDTILKTPIDDFIDTSPVEKENKVLPSVVNTDINFVVKTNKLVSNISKNSFKYKLLKTILIFVFTIMPLLILIITIVYSYHIINIPAIVKEKRFYADLMIYRELDNIYNIFGLGIYINDYVLYMLIICLIYIMMLFYIFFSPNVKYKDNTYKEYITKIYFLLGTVLGILIIHISVYAININKIGSFRDKLNNLVSEYINTKYIDFIHENNTSADIYVVNNQDNLIKYITGILIEIKTKTAPSDYTLISVEQFKEYKDTDGDRYYDLILKAIITYNLILNIRNNEYNSGGYKYIDKTYFYNKKSLLLTINYKKNNLLEIGPRNCIDKIIDGKNNTSQFITQICKDCRILNYNINELIINIRNTMNNITFPPQTLTAIVVLVICIIYYYSFFAIEEVKTENIAEQQQE